MAVGAVSLLLGSLCVYQIVAVLLPIVKEFILRAFRIARSVSLMVGGISVYPHVITVGTFMAHYWWAILSGIVVILFLIQEVGYLNYARRRRQYIMRRIDNTGEARYAHGG